MRGLIIGRFQPFHLGHLRLIEFAAREVDSLIIGTGSSQESHTRQNPFTAEERRMMVENSITGKFEIFDIPDVNDDRTWVSHVEKIVPKFDSVYTYGELERQLFKEAGYPVRATPFFDRGNYSGTEIRRRILAGEEWKDLVPEGTLKVMNEIRGEERIKKLG